MKFEFCLPGYITIMISIISIILSICCCLVSTGYIYIYEPKDKENKPISTNIFGNTCGIICNIISFVICVFIIGLICPYENGRIILWLLLICNIILCFSAMSITIATLKEILYQ